MAHRLRRWPNINQTLGVSENIVGGHLQPATASVHLRVLVLEHGGRIRTRLLCALYALHHRL